TSGAGGRTPCASRRPACRDAAGARWAPAPARTRRPSPPAALGRIPPRRPAAPPPPAPPPCRCRTPERSCCSTSATRGSIASPGAAAPAPPGSPGPPGPLIAASWRALEAEEHAEVARVLALGGAVRRHHPLGRGEAE